MILEETCDYPIEVYTVCSPHVMLVLWVNHVVGVSVCLHASLYEELRVLPEHNWVNRAVDQKEASP